MASYVSTLNSRVPTNWIAALHHDASAPEADAAAERRLAQLERRRRR